MIRTVREDEADDFLGLLCRCFDLNPDRAASVFYHEPGFSLDRKWALFHEGKMVSILTVGNLAFGFGPAISIAGVATEPKFRGQGFAERLIRHVVQVYSDRPALLFATKTVVYARCGFEVVDRVIESELLTQASTSERDLITYDEVERRYEEWADQDSRRLIRNELNWKVWSWSVRVCEPMMGGYIVADSEMIREAVFEPNGAPWPIPQGSRWYGLEKTTQKLKVPVSSSKVTDLMLMARGLSEAPIFFMSDQF